MISRTLVSRDCFPLRINVASIIALKKPASPSGTIVAEASVYDVHRAESEKHIGALIVLTPEDWRHCVLSAIMLAT